MSIRHSSVGIPSLSPLLRKRTLAKGIRDAIFLRIELASILHSRRGHWTKLGACIAHHEDFLSSEGTPPARHAPCGSHARDAAMNEIDEKATRAARARAILIFDVAISQA